MRQDSLPARLTEGINNKKQESSSNPCLVEIVHLVQVWISGQRAGVRSHLESLFCFVSSSCIHPFVFLLRVVGFPLVLSLRLDSCSCLAFFSFLGFYTPFLYTLAPSSITPGRDDDATDICRRELLSVKGSGRSVGRSVGGRSVGRSVRSVGRSVGGILV